MSFLPRPFTKALPENAAMLEVFEKCGLLRKKSEAQIVQIVLELNPQGLF